MASHRGRPSTLESPRRRTLLLETKQDERVRACAKRHGQSMQHIMRAAIGEYLDGHA